MFIQKQMFIRLILKGLIFFKWKDEKEGYWEIPGNKEREIRLHLS